MLAARHRACQLRLPFPHRHEIACWGIWDAEINGAAELFASTRGCYPTVLEANHETLERFARLAHHGDLVDDQGNAPDAADDIEIAEFATERFVLMLRVASDLATGVYRLT